MSQLGADERVGAPARASQSPRGHGCSGRQRGTASGSPLPPGIEVPGAAQVFRIRRDTFDHAGNRLSKEVVHGVASLTAAQSGPEQVARFVRQHWGIENKSHYWVRDTVYREDHQHAYAGTGAQVMATLRNLTLGLLRLAGITQITRTLQRIAAANSTNRL